MSVHTSQVDAVAKRVSDSDRVIDIGGGAAPYPRADHVIDLVPYAGRGALLAGEARRPERFSDRTWTQWDICSRKPWPFPDRSFDFAVCTHVLEDVRDPLWICSEMQRIAKAGYIETPSRAVEQSKGVEHPCYAGFYHHRWLVNAEANKLQFRLKPHSLHVLPAAIVAHVGPWRRIHPDYEVVSFHWNQAFAYEEALAFDEQAVNDELCRTAGACRNQPHLTVRVSGSLMQRVRRFVYFSRLKAQAQGWGSI